MSLSYCPTLEDLYRTRQAVGQSGRTFDLTGGLSTVNNLAAIRHMMLAAKPQRTLEIGMACGGSALTIAASHRDAGFIPCCQHIAIDAWQRDGFDNVARVLLERAGLDGYVEVREQLSSLALPKMLEEKLKFGLVYIDGSHRFEDVFCDFYYVRFLTEVGGFILFDDAADPEVAKVLRFIRANQTNFFERVPVYTFRRMTTPQRLKHSFGDALYKTQLAVFRKIADGERPGGQRLSRF
jgi:predicted O-methyltransferase YrrM